MDGGYVDVDGDVSVAGGAFPSGFLSTGAAQRGGGTPVLPREFNPFAAPAYTISGLKDARTRLQRVYFPVQQRLLSTLCVFVTDYILSHASTIKKTKGLKGLKFRTIIGPFQVTSWQWRG